MKELIKAKAMNCCFPKAWCPSTCMLGLSSVIEQEIQSVYPDYGMYKIRAMYNNIIGPRVMSEEKSPINILFCEMCRKDCYTQDLFLIILFQ